MKIYVVGHSKNRFLPMINGREKFLIDIPHAGDNIDNLNPWFCELTGLYYLWKHCDDDIVGLEHYRRYLVNASNQLYTEDEVKNILSNYDIICPKAKYSKIIPVKTWLISHGKMQDFEKFLIFIKSYIGEDYYNSCLNILNGDYHACCNMMICKKELLSEYCTFIFDLVFKYMEAEKKYNRELPKRIIGYFTEFTFSAWLNSNNKNPYYTKMRIAL